MVALRIETIIYCVKCLDNHVHWFIDSINRLWRVAQFGAGFECVRN